MHKKLLLWILLFISWPVLAKNEPCQLTTAQVKELIALFSTESPQSNIQCENYSLTLNFPAKKQKTSFTIPVPFHLFAETHLFYGLAKYYNTTRPLTINQPDQIHYLTLPTQPQSLNENIWIGWNARFLLFVIQAPHVQVELSNETMHFQWDANTTTTLKIFLGPAEGDFAAIKYTYLWSWLAALCRSIETLLLVLGELLGNAWGVSIIALAIIFKLIFFPLQIKVTKLQKEVDRCHALLTPKLKQIKSQYDGEEAHKRIMAEYKQLGITPFFAMKPLIGPLIQLPLQVAIFNVLGEMPEMINASFGWINSLAYPDTLSYLPFTLPLLGNEFNLLPILMTTLAFVSTAFLTHFYGTLKEVKWKKYRLYFMAIAFFILFYPFPAGMVLFWTMMNLLHLIQQKLIK